MSLPTMTVSVDVDVEAALRDLSVEERARMMRRDIEALVLASDPDHPLTPADKSERECLIEQALAQLDVALPGCDSFTAADVRARIERALA